MSVQIRPFTRSENWVWDVGTLDWVVETQPGGAGGGDASAANQVIGNASLASIDGKLATLGQKVMAGSVPVVIASNQSAVSVSGTVAESNFPATVDTNSGLKSASTLRVVLATDQPALTNKLLVTPDSVALPANQSVNAAQLAGTATSVNSGTKDAGTLRVVIATDQPALTNKLLVTPDSVALPANQSVNVAQINAVTPLMGAGVTGTGSPRVTLATDGQGQVVDNAAFTDTVTRVDVAGYIFDDVAGTALTENDAAAARVDSKRAQVFVLEDATTRAQKQSVSAAGAAHANVAQIAAATVSTAASGVQKVGVVGNAGAIFDGALASATPANAIYLGARAATANPGNATTGNLVGVTADKAGRIITTHGHVRELIGVQQTNVAVATETTIVTAGGASVFNDISQLIITTAGAAAQTITIKDATAGTTRMVLNYPNAALAPGAPLVINFNPPLVQAAANANWTVTQGAATACNYTVVFLKNL